MVKQEFIDDVMSGISLGLEYKFRCIKYNKQYVLYHMDDGKIVEYIENQKSDFLTYDFAIKKLYEINSLEQTLDEETKRAIDETS